MKTYIDCCKENQQECIQQEIERWYWCCKTIYFKCSCMKAIILLLLSESIVIESSYFDVLPCYKLSKVLKTLFCVCGSLYTTLQHIYFLYAVHIVDFNFIIRFAYFFSTETWINKSSTYKIENWINLQI